MNYDTASALPMHPPTKLGHIKAAEDWLGRALPTAYADFLLSHEERIIGEQVLLYPAEYLVERNETFETKVYCPGYLAIGDDSGGRAIVISVHEPLDKVYMVDHGDMSPESFERIPLPFNQWLQQGCPVGDSQ